MTNAMRKFCSSGLDLFSAPQLKFIRYLVVGGWNTVFGLAVYAGLYYWLGDSVHYLVLAVPANILAITNAYICYKLIVFRTRGNILREYFRCYIVYGGTMLAGAAALWVLVEWFGMSPVAANCVSTVALTFVSYLSHRSFSFKPS